ncbi:hypothetical protein EDEG_00548 [Edhazardia aedis USNM 41457]|uniref:GPI-anchor transamidase n=1 Tax=Edhazardia aedis (strain USNM 41457) TaxID=1003232 RepID=J8ZNI8_EDHAE|nr:hypothetical protein EDEG_00548 [Edhazardia aedis USNM 41457]|eukprot:EJW01248.1 hypothetical protein EDEG_00548 [Edhazardia aedis USNM 41457]
MFFLLLFTCIEPKNVAILINTSKDYFNYRHSSNVFLFRKLLLDSGFKEEDILIAMQDNAIQDRRNIYPNRYYFDKNKYDQLEEIKIDLLSTNKLLNLLRCNHEKLYALDKESNVFLYICGHGGDEFIKILDREFLHAKDLMTGLNYLAFAVKKIFLILDTCQAETLVYKNKLPKNVFVLASSKKGEPSIAIKGNRNVGCTVIDSFPHTFYIKFKKINNMDVSIEEFTSTFTVDEVMSNIVLMKKSSNWFLGEFFTSNDFVGN